MENLLLYNVLKINKKNMKIFKKIICLIFGHSWRFMEEPKYEGEKNGKFCNRCDLFIED